MTATVACWKCGAAQVVAGLGCHNLTEEGTDLARAGDRSQLFLLSYVASLPQAVLHEIQKRNPRYQKHWSRTAEEHYCANACECGALFGDFHLYSEPESAFFPLDEAAAAKVTLQSLPFDGLLTFECAYSQGDANQCILDNAQRN